MSEVVLHRNQHPILIDVSGIFFVTRPFWTATDHGSAADFARESWRMNERTHACRELIIVEDHYCGMAHIFVSGPGAKMVLKLDYHGFDRFSQFLTFCRERIVA